MATADYIPEVITPPTAAPVDAPPHADLSSHPAETAPPAETAGHEPPRQRATSLHTLHERCQGRFDYATAFWIGMLHLGALAAPFYFSWESVVLTLFLGWLTGGVGICLGFHRLFTHRSFATYRPIRWAIAFLGGLAGEGSVVHWVANHRKHHALSDREGDPHSPLDGAWWSHMLWFYPRFNRAEYAAYNRRWAPDLMKDPFLRFLDATFLLWHILFGAALWGLGWAYGGGYYAWSFLLWGMFVRLVYVLHSTWLVNSATHMWGYRNYPTDDQSRNLWWVALLTYGEGWHNNHHAYPRMARHGHRWWEVDTTWWLIRTMERAGLCWDVVDGQHKKATQGHTLTAAAAPQPATEAVPPRKG